MSIAIVLIILFLELSAPSAPLTVALRNWQTGFAAIFGLVGIAITIANTERLEQKRLEDQGLTAVVAMQHEMIDMRRWLNESKLYFDLKDITPNEGVCASSFSGIPRYESLELIKLHRKSLGLMPGTIGLHFIGAERAHRRLLKFLTDKDRHKLACKRETKQHMALANAFFDGFEAKLELVERGVQHLAKDQRLKKMSVPY